MASRRNVIVSALKDNDEIVTAAMGYMLTCADESSDDDQCGQAAIAFFVKLPPDVQDEVCDHVDGFGPKGERIREMDQDKLFELAEQLTYHCTLH